MKLGSVPIPKYLVRIRCSDLRRWKLAMECPDIDKVPRNLLTDRVRNFPRFDDFGKNLPLLSGFGFVGLVYGGLHCVAWNAPFSTTVERYLWRLSSIVITGTGLFTALLLIWTKSTPLWYIRSVRDGLWSTRDPIFRVFNFFIRRVTRWLDSVQLRLTASEKQQQDQTNRILGKTESTSYRHIELQRTASGSDEQEEEIIEFTEHRAIVWRASRMFASFARASIYALHFLTKASLDISIAACCALYVLARFYLVVISFVNLAYLPDSAYSLVSWSRYIPHFG
ncbi:hypothetical protein B0T20DRAFT_401844 [Sordaria brevicollis]|uniref:Uncharacterized protein n=1 Tax=Sordaria brevicollis TaxID=83679 RepID=A0AAE0PK36_SORBR|nr:hypothetical protein B0T20DRAFT_401844 [Sordaria brevicollis]